MNAIWAQSIVKTQCHNQAEDPAAPSRPYGRQRKSTSKSTRTSFIQNYFIHNVCGRKHKASGPGHSSEAWSMFFQNVRQISRIGCFVIKHMGRAGKRSMGY